MKRWILSVALSLLGLALLAVAGFLAFIFTFGQKVHFWIAVAAFAYLIVIVSIGYGMFHASFKVFKGKTK